MPKDGLYRTVVFGPTGSGKSQFCNFSQRDLENKINMVSDSLNSCTQDPQSNFIERCGIKIELIDTAGSNDTGNKDVENLEKVCKYLRPKSQIDYIILLLNYEERLQKNTRDYIKILGDMFTPREFYTHFCVVFSHLPEKENKKVKEKKQMHKEEVNNIINEIFGINPKEKLPKVKVYFLNTEVDEDDDGNKKFDEKSQLTVDILIEQMVVDVSRYQPINTTNIETSGKSKHLREDEQEKKIKQLEKILKEKKEREKREEEERKKREEEEKKGKEEEARKRKEEEENLIKKGLQKINKKEKDLSEAELKRLLESEIYEKSVEDYNKVTHRDYIDNYEGIDIKFTFEEINQISTDSLNDIEVTKGGKILALSHKDVSKITIYSPKTYEEEDCIIFESKVNSMKIDDKYIYCALNENTENILIISMDNYYNKIYLSGHNCAVTDLAIYKYGNFVSADKNGTVIHWEDNKIKKVLNDIKGYINTICLIGTIVAILSFKLEMVKFYDLRYSCLECIETIRDIKGSGFKNNMLKLNPNILAISGTYIYIIDLNSLIVTNRIYCLYANDSISSFHFNKKGYFFVSQALTHLWNNDIEKGILGYYQYNFKSEIIPEYNSLIKLASKSKCHNNFISAIKQLDKKTIVTGSFDGKIKFWNLKEI